MTATEKAESFYNRQVREIKERIKKDLARHTIQTTLKRGLYRHYICKTPHTNVLWFEVITWPGGLAINGDMGTYTFSRTADMIAFMRSASMSFAYAAEKCRAADRDGIKTFRQECFVESMDYEIECAEESDDYERVTKLQELRDEINQWAEEDAHETYRLMHKSGLFDCDVPNCLGYTLSFLWNLHAIKWLCDRVEDYRPSIWTRIWNGVLQLTKKITRLMKRNSSN